jgi:hypothetical protein
MQMSIELAKETGQKYHAIAWTDAELQDQINVLGIVIAWMEGRGDCGILLSGLRIKLEQYRDFQQVRQRHGRKI